MKKILLFLFLLRCCFADHFDDPYTKMSFEVPQGFVFDESKSSLSNEGGNWWYAFCDEGGSLLIFEIDEYCGVRSLPDYFHNSLAEVPEFESIIYEEMEFKNIEIDALRVTRCKLRIVAVSENAIEPLYFCDYFFIKEPFGFSISLTAKEKSLSSNSKQEEMMLSLIKSIRFSP